MFSISVPSCLLASHQTYKSDNSITSYNVSLDSDKNDQLQTVSNPTDQSSSNIVPVMIDTARKCRHNANDIISAFRISTWQKILTLNHFNVDHIPQWIRCNQCKQLRANKIRT